MTLPGPWAVAALVPALGVWYVAYRELGSRLAAAGAALAVAVTVAYLPLQIDHAVKRANTYEELTRPQAERFPAHRVHPSPQVFDRLRARIPDHATYFLYVKDSTGELVSGGGFRHWALGWLLPRVAVATPRQARWIVSRFADPGTAGVPVADVRKLAPNTFVARVRR